MQVKEKNVSGSATSFALNLGGDDATGEGDAGSSNAPSPSPISAAPAYTESAGNADAADSSDGTTEEEDGPLSFSSSSYNSHRKTTLHATQSSQQSASSQSSSSTNADIEDSSSGSTSLSFSISGFEYETTSGSKSEFSYLSESQSSSDSPVGSDGRPSTHSEATSSHVIETLEESERTFGFGFGSDGLNVTNEYSSNDTVSDVLKSESTSGSWRLVYPIITSSLAMMTNPQSTAPNWVAGPELEMTSGHNIQFNYGGNLEDGFEGSYSETTDFSQEFLNQEGSVYRYEYTLTISETYPNSNLTDASNSDANSAGGSNTGESGSGDYVFTVAPAAASTPQWHHLFPRKWVEEFAAMGINIHDAKWGWLMDPADHGKLTPAWTEHWDSFFDGPGDRTQAEAIEHLAEGLNRQEFLPIYNKGAKPTLGFHQWNGLDASVKTAKFKALQKALKVLTVAFTTFGAFDDSRSVFAGVLKLNNEAAQQEFADAIDGLIKHQEDPNGGHLDSALTAMFGDVMARADMSSVSRINPAGVITKLLAGQVEADAMSLNPAMSAFNEIQEYINSHAN